MARQREARAANAGEDRKQLEWMQESRKDAKKGLKSQNMLGAKFSVPFRLCVLDRCIKGHTFP